jgi:hypothetical protein
VAITTVVTALDIQIQDASGHPLTQIELGQPAQILFVLRSEDSFIRLANEQILVAQIAPGSSSFVTVGMVTTDANGYAYFHLPTEGPTGVYLYGGAFMGDQVMDATDVTTYLPVQSQHASLNVFPANYQCTPMCISNEWWDCELDVLTNTHGPCDVPISDDMLVMLGIGGLAAVGVALLVIGRKKK